MVLSDVYFWGLHKIKLVVSRLFHKIEYCVFKHIFNHVCEVLIQEAVLSYDIIVIISCQLFQIISVNNLISHHISSWRAKSILLFFIIIVLVPNLICRWWIHITGYNLVEYSSACFMTVIKKSIHLLIVKNVIHHFIQNVLENSFSLSCFDGVCIFSL